MLLNESLSLQYSYDSDLWGGFNLIITETKNKIQSLISLLYLFTEIESIERDYSDKLSNAISCLVYDEQSKDGLSTALREFKAYLMQLVDNHRSQANELKQSMISWLISMIDLGKTMVSAKIKANEDDNHEYDNSRYKLDSQQTDYNTAAKELFESFNDLKIKEFNKNKLTEGFNITKDVKKKKNAFDQKQELYLKYVNEANIKRENFISKQKEMYSQIETMHISIRNEIKKNLTHYFTNERNNYTNLISLTQNIENTFQAIEAQKDVQMFIKINRTFQSPPSKFDFVPYKSQIEDLNTYLGLDSSKDKTKHLFTVIQSFLDQELNYKYPELKIEDNLKLESYEFLQSSAKNLWGNHLETSELSKLMKFFNEHSYRIFFLKTMNKQRTQFGFLSPQSFEKLVTIIDTILFQSKNDNDIATVKFVFNLAQTLYTSGVDDARVILQEKIKHHMIFKEIQIWEEIIKEQITEAVGGKLRDGQNGEKVKPKERVIKDLVHNVLVNAKFNLNAYDVDKETIMNLIEKYAKEYELEENEMKELGFGDKRLVDNEDEPNVNMINMVIDANARTDIIGGRDQ
jgi:hypothetical protein